MYSERINQGQIAPPESTLAKALRTKRDQLLASRIGRVIKTSKRGNSAMIQPVSITTLSRRVLPAGFFSGVERCSSSSCPKTLGSCLGQHANQRIAPDPTIGLKYVQSLGPTGKDGTDRAGKKCQHAADLQGVLLQRRERKFRI